MKTLPTNASKQEEIEHLEALAKTCADGTYLAGLFAPGFMAWMKQQIRDDVDCNVFNYLTVANERVMAAEAVVSQFRQALDATEQKYAELNQQWRMQAAENERQAKVGRDLLGGQVNLLSDRVEELHGQKFALGVELHGERDRAADLEAEVLRLKAEIYDLEHGKKGGVA